MRKILVSLLVVSMLLGLVGTAYAAGFSDTTDASILKAAAYGWVGGYEDGTFKPAGNITRAEAAKMIVSAMGLTAAADAAKGLAPKFTDVPATHWASGYINVCVAQSVLKGYADNTFKPEANITGAEIVTMIVRGLKRESEAIGDWPVGHVTVAAANNIIGTGFSASALATRANVAAWLVKASKVNTLKLDTAGWVDSGKTWLTAKFDVVTGTVSKVDAANAKIYIVGTAYDLATGYTIAGGKTLTDLVGRVCNLTRDIVNDEISFVEIKTDVVVKTGTVSSVGVDLFYLTGDTTKYTVAAVAPNLDLIVYRNGTRIVNKDITTLVGTIAKDDVIEFYASSTNVVSYITSNKFAHSDVEFTDLNKTVAPYTVTFGGANYYVPSTATITLNGAAATITDLKTGMFANVAVDPIEVNTIVTINAVNTLVEGKITAIRTSVGSSTTYYVTVNGTEYRLAMPDGVDAGTDTTAENIAARDALSGNTAKLYLNVTGRVQKYTVTASATPFGKVLSFVDDGTGTTATANTKWIVDVKGVSTTYEAVDADSDDLRDGTNASIAVGDYIKLGFNGDGTINKLTTSELTLVGVEDIISIYHGVDDSLFVIDNGVAADVNVTADSKTVVFVNGVLKTLADLEAEQMIKYAVDPAAVTKIAVILGDTVVTYDAGKVISPIVNRVQGLAGAVEGSAVVNFYSDVFRTVLVGTVTAASDGSFTIDLPAGATTMYVKVTDTYSNSINANWTVLR